MSPDYYNIDTESKQLRDNVRYKKAVKDLLYFSTITLPCDFICVNILPTKIPGKLTGLQ